MTKYFKTIIFCLLFIINHFASGQVQQAIIDLADKNEIIEYVKPNVTLTLLVKNRLPYEIYSISVEKKMDLLEQLKTDSEMSFIPKNQSECSIPSYLKEMNEAKSEKELAITIDKLEKVLKEEETNTSVKKCSEGQISEAKSFLKSTTKTLLPQKLQRGEYLEVTISRKKKDSDSEYVTWKRVYKTKKRGKWLTTYGFTYISQSFKKKESFFAKQADSTYVITPLNQRSRLSFVPSVFFTWLPYNDINKDISWSMTGGLGYDLEAPTVFLGANILYNHNLGVSVGIAAHQQEFLKGQYNDGDVIIESLDTDQLNEKLYVLNPFISINFRFGASPLKKETAETE